MREVDGEHAKAGERDQKQRRDQRVKPWYLNVKAHDVAILSN